MAFMEVLRWYGLIRVEPPSHSMSEPYKNRYQRACSRSTLWGHSKESSTGAGPCWNLIWTFQLAQPWENKLLLFKPLSLWFIISVEAKLNALLTRIIKTSWRSPVGDTEELSAGGECMRATILKAFPRTSQSCCMLESPGKFQKKILMPKLSLSDRLNQNLWVCAFKTVQPRQGWESLPLRDLRPFPALGVGY